MKQEKAFLQAFDEYADALFRHCFYRVSDREKATDIVQDTFTKTWDYLVKGNEVREFRPFLYQTLNRLIIDEYRRKKSDSLDTLLEQSEGTGALHVQLSEGGFEDVAIAMDAKALMKHLDDMPAHYKEVIVMRYVDGLQPQEIADITGKSTNVVSVHIHRGIMWLRKRVDEQ